MNALRNFLSNRASALLFQNGQNALFNNFTQSPQQQQEQQHQQNQQKDDSRFKPATIAPPLRIPKSILNATIFQGKKLQLNGPLPKPILPAATSGSISPNTLRRYRRMERKVELVYRCTLCNTRNRKLVTEAAYKGGVVILQCDGCAVDHLIIDNLGWFSNTKGKSFDQVIAERSDRVKIIKVNEHGELI